MPKHVSKRVDRATAEEAVRTLIKWAGDDPSREGLLETPARVVRAYEEFFAGYAQYPRDVLAKTFEEVAGYNEIVLLRNMNFESHCEHHIVPIIGRAHIAYIPQKRVVGISKIARVLDIFAKRMQTQETMTSQIGQAIEDALQPKGVSVIISASHQCMTTRGVHKPDVDTVTTFHSGQFTEDANTRQELLRMIGTI
ncbi:MAG: GTP cyclohydrolase I FolE [Pseudomonadota bacterium]